MRTPRFRDGMLHVVRGLAKKGDGPAMIALARFGISYRSDKPACPSLPNAVRRAMTQASMLNAPDNIRSGMYVARSACAKAATPALMHTRPASDPMIENQC